MTASPPRPPTVPSTQPVTGGRAEPHHAKELPPPLPRAPLAALKHGRGAASGVELTPQPALEPGRRLDLVLGAAKALERLRALAAEPACLMLLGEPNSGKSTAANRLIGTAMLPTNVTRATRLPALIRHAARVEVFAVAADGERQALAPDDEPGPDTQILHIGLPGWRWHGFSVLDTPRGSAPSSHAALPGVGTLAIPIWCTSATQAWKASEAAAWAQLPARLRRRGLLLVTGLDRIAADSDRRRLAQRLTDEAGEAFRAIAYTPDATFAGETLEAIIEGHGRAILKHRRRTIAALSERVASLRRALAPQLAPRT